MKGRSWEEDPRGPYITVGPNQRVYLLDPDPSEYIPEIIAYRLAGINRYTGGSRFSVGQHCVVAAEMARRFYPSAKMLPPRMLIHDADESVVHDLPSPLKSILPGYTDLEEKHQLAVEKRFDLTFIGDDLVDEVDLRMWLTERQLGLGPGGSALGVDYHGDLLPFYMSHDEVQDSCWHPWDDDEAELEWLNAYRKLFPWCQ